MLFKDENPSLFPAQNPFPERITPMATQRYARPSIQSLLSDDRIRRIEAAGRTWYVAADVAEVLAETEHALEYWSDLKGREPHVAALAEQAEIDGNSWDVLDLDGLLRLIQSIHSPRAERLKWW